MEDPRLNACREAVSIPVIGPCQTALHVASMLGGKFSFITVLERLRPMISHLVASYGLTEHYASFAAVDVPVLELESSMEKLTAGLVTESIKAVRENHAGAIVLGCTGLLGCSDAIVAGLKEQGLHVPVIDPIPLALHIADALVKTGLSHSKAVYPMPSEKKRIGFDIPGFSQL